MTAAGIRTENEIRRRSPLVSEDISVEIIRGRKREERSPRGIKHFYAENGIALRRVPGSIVRP